MMEINSFMFMSVPFSVYSLITPPPAQKKKKKKKKRERNWSVEDCFT